MEISSGHENHLLHTKEIWIKFIIPLYKKLFECVSRNENESCFEKNIMVSYIVHVTQHNPVANVVAEN